MLSRHIKGRSLLFIYFSKIIEEKSSTPTMRLLQANIALLALATSGRFRNDTPFAASDMTTVLAKKPKSYGVALYPEFELLDIGGTLEALNFLARVRSNETITLSVLAKTLDPVTPGPISPDKTGAKFAGHQRWLPTHTFENAPDLDVLLVPGGLGTYNPPAGYPPLPSGSEVNNSELVEFIKDRYPKLQYLITVCTGAALAAQAGVLDGRNATTNKAAFNRKWESS